MTYLVVCSVAFVASGPTLFSALGLGTLLLPSFAPFFPVEQSVARTPGAFGCSRPTFEQAHAAFKAQGLPGLVPRKRGPQGALKLDEAVMAFVHGQRTDDPTVSVPALLAQIRRRFGLAVHRRTLERALRREEKKRR